MMDDADRYNNYQTIGVSDGECKIWGHQMNQFNVVLS